MAEYHDVVTQVSSFLAEHPEVVAISLVGAALGLNIAHYRHKARQKAEAKKEDPPKQTAYRSPPSYVPSISQPYSLSRKESEAWDRENKQSREWFRQKMNVPTETFPNEEYDKIAASLSNEVPESHQEK